MIYDSDAFPQNLGRIMAERRISIAELSRKTGLSKPTLRSWKRGTCCPRSPELCILCDALNVTPNDLFRKG